MTNKNDAGTRKFAGTLLKVVGGLWALLGGSWVAAYYGGRADAGGLLALAADLGIFSMIAGAITFFVGNGGVEKQRLEHEADAIRAT